MTAVDLDALDKLRHEVAAVLRTHGQADHDPQTGTFDCRCDEWSGNFLSYHQADRLLTFALPDLIAEARKYRVLREDVEDVLNHIPFQGPAGLEHRIRAALDAEP